MAYDEGLAQRFQDHLAHRDDLEEKKMFGGWGLMVRGNLCVGVIGEDAILRVGPEAYASCLAEPHAREFDFTGRPMKGWVTVAAEGLEDEAELARWVDIALQFVLGLEPK